MMKKVIVFGGLVAITMVSFAQITLDDLVSAGLYATDTPGIPVYLLKQLPSESRAQYFIRKFDTVSNITYQRSALVIKYSIAKLIDEILFDCQVSSLSQRISELLNPSAEEQQKGAHPHEWYTARATNYVFRKDIERYYDELKKALADYLIKAGGRGNDDVYTATDVLKKLSASINVWKQDDTNYLALSGVDPNNLSQLQDKLDALSEFEQNNKLMFGENPGLDTKTNNEIRSLLAGNKELRDKLEYITATKNNARAKLMSIAQCGPNEELASAQITLEKLTDESKNSPASDRAVYAKNINSCIIPLYNHLKTISITPQHEEFIANATKQLNAWGIAVNADVFNDAQDNLTSAFAKAKSDFAQLQAYENVEVVRENGEKVTFEVMQPNQISKSSFSTVDAVTVTLEELDTTTQKDFDTLLRAARLYFALKGTTLDVQTSRGLKWVDFFKILRDKIFTSTDKEVIELIKQYTLFKERKASFIRLLERVAQGLQQLKTTSYVSALALGSETASTTEIDEDIKQKREALLTTFAASVAVLDAAKVFTDKSPQEKDEIVKNALPYVLQTYRNLNKVAGKKDTPLIAEGIRLINMFNDVFRKPSAYYIDMAKIK
jgi:hypothetical protein